MRRLVLSWPRERMVMKGMTTEEVPSISCSDAIMVLNTMILSYCVCVCVCDLVFGITMWKGDVSYPP